MIQKWSVLWIWFFIASGLLRGQSQEQKPRQPTFVYLTREEALEEVLPGAVRFRPDTIVLNEAQRRALQAELRTAQVDSQYVVYLAYDEQDRLLGYAMELNEIGKYEPITFMVGVGTDLRVRRVAIMVYRESRGGEVRQPRFLYQYRGRKPGDPLQPGRDIINISGATLSVQAVSRGVRLALAVLEAGYGKAPENKK